MEPEEGREEFLLEGAKLTTSERENPGSLFASAILLFVVTAALFIPFPKAPGLVEEWSIVYAFDRGQPWIAPDVSSSMATRPFMALWYGLPYTLTPDSFFGLHLFHLLFILGKGFAACALARRLLPGDPAGWALVGALLVVFPADTYLFSTRIVGYHAAILLILLAILLLFRFADSPRLLTGLGIAASQALSLGTYEIGYPILLFAPLALWIVPPGLPKTRRARARLLGVWYATPLLLGLWTLMRLLRGDTYESNLVTRGGASALEIMVGTLGALPQAVARHFVASWGEAAHAAARAPTPDIAVAVLAALAAAFAVLRLRGQTPARRSVLLFLAGLAAIVLGVLPHLVVPAFRHETRRVYLLSSLGGALSLAAALVFVRDRAGRLLAAFLASVFVFLGTTGAREQSRVHEETGRRVRDILRGVAGTMPHLAEGTLVLYLDDTGPPRTQELFGLTSTDVHLADAVRVAIRRGDLILLVYGRRVPEPWNGAAAAGPAGVTVSWKDGRSVLFPYEKVAAFREDAGGRVSLLDTLPADLFPFPDAARYAPGPLLGSGPPPPRLATLAP